ncbi:MAG: divalent cation tolerance protein CutA, partial [Candidatus Neomarinimicrobiota bacterium]
MEPDDNNLKIIITTHDDLLLAKELARMLVERRAAACVNLIPNVTSIFHWEKSLQVETEIIMLI